MLKALPVKIPAANATRPITKKEEAFYKSMVDHYRERSLADPLNRIVTARFKYYVGLLQSKTIHTWEA